MCKDDTEGKRVHVCMRYDELKNALRANENPTSLSKGQRTRWNDE
jgi:hypothetical protein